MKKLTTRLNTDKLQKLIHAAGFGIKGGRMRLAQLLGVGYYTIYHWIRGTYMPSEPRLRRLIEFLNDHLPQDQHITQNDLLIHVELDETSTSILDKIKE